jgi:hypothetical protein
LKGEGRSWVLKHECEGKSERPTHP